MSSGSSGIVGSALIILSGAVMYVGGLIAHGLSSSFDANDCANVGIGFLAVGGLLLLIEYALVWKRYMRKREIGDCGKREFSRNASDR